jgi:membrane-associated phospholipid phosphatase
MPLFGVLILLKTNTVSSIEMPSKKERSLPLFVNFICVCCCFFLLNKLFFFNHFLSGLFIGVMLTLFFALLISRFWKISLHMLGAGGLLGILINLNILTGASFYIIIVWVFISGALAYARLKENAHTSLQIYTGFLLGFLCQLSIGVFIL